MGDRRSAAPNTTLAEALCERDRSSGITLYRTARLPDRNHKDTQDSHKGRALQEDQERRQENTGATGTKDEAKNRSRKRGRHQQR